MIKTRLVSLKGRKAVVAAEMWTLAGEQLADATFVPLSSLLPFPSLFSVTSPLTHHLVLFCWPRSAVYVEPRWAPLLKGSGVEELLGKRPDVEVGVKPSVLAVDHGN